MENNSTANNELATTQKNETGMMPVDLNSTLPDLTNAKEFPVDLVAEYWTPDQIGESKRVFFDRIAPRMVKDATSETLIELECATFLESINGEAKSISNGSKRLVGALQSQNVQRGTPLLITYLGKKKNKSNSFQSDNWSVKPLIINI